MSYLALEYAKQKANKQGFEFKPKSFISNQDNRKIEIAENQFIVVYSVHFCNSTVGATYQLTSVNGKQTLFCPGLNTILENIEAHHTKLEIKTPPSDTSTLIINYLLITQN